MQPWLFGVRQELQHYHDTLMALMTRSAALSPLSIFPGCKTRNVGRAEIASNPKAHQALARELEELRALPRPSPMNGGAERGMKTT